MTFTWAMAITSVSAMGKVMSSLSILQGAVFSLRMTAIELKLSGGNLGQTLKWARSRCAVGSGEGKRDVFCLSVPWREALERGQANHQLQDRKNLTMPQVSQHLQLGLPASRAVRTNACQDCILLHPLRVPYTVCKVA